MNEGNSEFQLDENYGLDDDGVTECYQYHPKKMPVYKIKMNLFDKFYREVCAPMYLMKIDVFNKILVEMVKQQGGTMQSITTRGSVKSTDFIKAA